MDFQIMKAHREKKSITANTGDFFCLLAVINPRKAHLCLTSTSIDPLASHISLKAYDWIPSFNILFMIIHLCCQGWQ